MSHSNPTARVHRAFLALLALLALGFWATSVFAQSTADIYYIHPDHLNTPRVITNNVNQVVWRWDNLDPFGANAPNENPGGLGIFTCNLRLPGQYFDRETKLHYNYFRDYDAGVGRYVESDPIGIKGSVNLYAYVDGNPVSNTDPLGLMGFGGGGSAGRGNMAPRGAPSPVGQGLGAAGDFLRNYGDMRTSNTIGGDKYFHCKANCEAARRGPTGATVACWISNGREWFDQNVKGDPPSASDADQAANAYGRGWGANSALPCELACMTYRPNGLPPQY